MGLRSPQVPVIVPHEHHLLTSDSAPAPPIPLIVADRRPVLEMAQPIGIKDVAVIIIHLRYVW